MSDIFTTITSADWRSTFAERRDQPRGNSMKKLIALLLLGAAKLTASEDLALLRAIAEVESGNNPKAVGLCGSRGLYQMKEATWRMHTDLPFDRAFNALDAQLVALKHLRFLRAHIEVNCKIQCTTVHLAYAWRYGQNSFSTEWRQKETNERRLERLEYGARIDSLFREYKEHEQL